ncbi:hypothetical protein B0T22DRAFT_444915 [Podospora appendiculata]|uniref:BZIP domain-containing protein n=1 Tax=Podospora appendiculata TaxID=314037 RepID=A0AAE1C8F0_9PEZI|nr:hypothetical protein B0T22DRAFT_444915 [Podospora appendiculata]
MSVDQLDPTKEESDDSMDSSPEGEAPTTATAQENQQPKRKGGRKPIYATSEERKQRNRQAQAAFRERRTEYIKQLEEAIRTHEQNLANLQAAHRHAADECLMLRYKNSLLERILLEKGIDVQAELRAKTNSPNLGPTHMPQNMVHPPPIQRALLNRHHSRRSNSSIAPKLEPGVSPLPAPIHAHGSVASPKSRPTPSSHSASPTATASFGSQPGASPASSDQMMAPIRPQMPPGTSMKAPPAPQVGGMSLSAQRQMQMAQLQHGAGHSYSVSTEQEYDAAADMMEDPGDAPDTPGPGPYPGQSYTGDPQSMSLSSPTTTGPPTSQQMAGHPSMDSIANSQHPAYPSMTQLLDPGFDFDPFGLSASMVFPTQFSFDTSNMR